MVLLGLDLIERAELVWKQPTQVQVDNRHFTLGHSLQIFPHLLLYYQPYLQRLNLDPALLLLTTGSAAPTPPNIQSETIPV